jgi:hypothetical protein
LTLSSSHQRTTTINMSDEIQATSGGFGSQRNSKSSAPGQDVEVAQEAACNNDVASGAPPTNANSSPDAAAPTKEVPWAADNTSIVNGRDESVMADVDDMKNNCYFLFPDWKTRQSKFWMLLILAAIIATSGVVGNSAATVIGASESSSLEKETTTKLHSHLCFRTVWNEQ